MSNNRNPYHDEIVDYNKNAQCFCYIGKIIIHTLPQENIPQEIREVNQEFLKKLNNITQLSQSENNDDSSNNNSSNTDHVELAVETSDTTKKVNNKKDARINKKLILQSNMILNARKAQLKSLEKLHDDAVQKSKYLIYGKCVSCKGINQTVVANLKQYIGEIEKAKSDVSNKISKLKQYIHHHTNKNMNNQQLVQ